jgi:type II secretory pathway pseudopilin PulG
MLVVVTIMMLLVAAAATQMRPATESRRIREAARALNVYLGSARNRAMETGRPCGVMLRRFVVSAGPPVVACVMTADQCEVPPSYAGGQTTSVATVSCAGNVATLNFYTDSTLTTAEPPIGMIRPGDLLQLDCQGPLYTVAPSSGTINPLDSNGYVTGATLTAMFDSTQGQIVPWPTGVPPATVTYQIFRSPTMTKSSATPLQLPASTVIDLDASGIDGNAPFGGAYDVAILFSSNGSVYGVSYAGQALNSVVQPIFLLLGKRERVGNPYLTLNNNVTTQTNDQDLTNLWVVVNPQTGLVTSGEIGADNGTRLIGSRSLARDAQSMGGK